jgi:hypothetical protein
MELLMYDIIGDIHGHATPLKALLSKMDYSEVDGVWQHAERKVIFLGDFIDRGPEQLEVIRIARSMVELGHALAVQGNHEFNAIAWATEHDDRAGEYLRPHSEKNRNQHKEFLKQVDEGSEKHKEVINWFKTLPLFLDLEGVRVVHACWHPASLQILKEYTDESNCILPHAWPELNRKNSTAYDALEIVLKGLEIPLPNGHQFADKDGHVRTDIRVKWWEKVSGATYKDLAVISLDALDNIPDTPISDEVLPGYENDKLLFVGHYWMSEEPEPLSKFIACLDYSIAAKAPASGSDNRKLCAYHWSGEKELSVNNFIYVRH